MSTGPTGSERRVMVQNIRTVAHDMLLLATEVEQDGYDAVSVMDNVARSAILLRNLSRHVVLGDHLLETVTPREVVA